MSDLRLLGGGLALDDVVAVSKRQRGARVGDASRLLASRAWLDERLRAGSAAPIYGVTTGFGSSRSVRLRADELEHAQMNLIRSHALGLALSPDDVVADDVVRATLLLRANAFLAGHSAVRLEIVEALLALLRHDVLPRMPLRGSVGASGDLAPLAHLALVIVGEGEASVPSGGARRVVPGAEALRVAGLEPLHLAAKEGLALINGTTVSCATLALAVHEAQQLALTADVACALALEALGGCARAFDAQVHRVRGHAGQEDAAASLRALLEGSRLASSTDDPQDNYSLRCAPQVHGASRDALSWVTQVVEREINAVTDNPLFFTLEGDAAPWDLAFAANAAAFGRTIDPAPVYSAGNFHGQPVAVAADVATIAAAELASISERRTALMLDPRFSRGLPAHLAARPGVESGMMIAQYAAASVVSENKGLAHPASVDSIPTGNGAEDHVPMATWAARKARSVVAQSAQVLALELLVAAQAVEWRCLLPDAAHAASYPEGDAADRFAQLPADAAGAVLGEGSRRAHALVRVLSPRLVGDRSLSPDAARLARAVLDGRFVEAADGRARPLRGLRFEDPAAS